MTYLIIGFILGLLTGVGWLLLKDNFPQGSED